MPARSSGGRQLLPLGTVSLDQHWFGEGLESAGAVTSDFSTFYFFFLVFFFSSFFFSSVLLSSLGSALAAGPLRENGVRRGCYRLLALPGSVKQRQLLISWR